MGYFDLFFEVLRCSWVDVFECLSGKVYGWKGWAMPLKYCLAEQGDSEIEAPLPYSQTFEERRIDLYFQQVVAGGGDETEVPVLEGLAIFVIVPEGEILGEEVVDAADSY